jgi:hypothetical protein
MSRYRGMWFSTSAGTCWHCRRHAADVLMYATDDNYRYCIDCRFDDRVVILTDDRDAGHFD